ncbi:hypothetical protein AURDEDRAFT_166048 [Auricularia subglabra TFB-10046 SS5]|nr:hypothetical protein AURDEDRAFT_166048 [Auricularia subglabra TFB-10046 SS5]
MEMAKQEESKRRSRGPMSCAECRRLKLNGTLFDAWFPPACRLQGPHKGTLAAGPGNRFVLADTQHLHEKIEAMSRRIAELEDALATLQSQLSNEKHPLLTDELMHLKAPPPTQHVESSMKDATETISDALGTLTLGQRPHFFGHHAASDYLLAREIPSDTPGSSACALPIDVFVLGCAFPMTSIRDGREKVSLRLADWLPSVQQAWYLVEAYYRDAAWLYVPIPQVEFAETIFWRVYSGTAPNVFEVTSHDLGVLFMILAIGCMVDLNRPPYNTDASNYYQLARVALGLDSVIDRPSIQAVRAIHMMSTFLQMCDHSNSATTCYSLLGLNAQLCQSLGLHRDDTPWNLSEPEQQRRRHVFWEVASYDSWTSLAFGRPPSFTLAHVDAKIATENDKSQNSEGIWQSSFRHWIHTFTQQVLLKVMDQAFGVAPLTYTTVLRLDRLVREHPISDGLRIANAGQIEPGISTVVLLQRHTVFALTQELLMILHRGFFANAVMEHPEDPLKSKYAQSVLVAFRCAFSITANTRALHTQCPLALRYWDFWSQSFSACLVLGSIVAKSPGCGLAPPAWVELDRMCELFEQVAPQSQRITRIMGPLRKMRLRAQQAYTTFKATTSGGPPRVYTEQEERGLKFLWGRTRLVTPKDEPPLSTPSPRSASSSRASSGSPGDTTGVSTGQHNFTTSVPGFGASQVDLSSIPDLGMGTHGGASCSPDDIFASLFSSYAQPQDQQHQGQQQQAYSWGYGGSQQAQAPGPSSMPVNQAPLPDFGMFSGNSSLPSMPDMSQLPSWNNEMSGGPLKWPDPIPGTMPATNLDIPWQRFMGGMGMFGEDDQQNGGAGPSSF